MSLKIVWCLDIMFSRGVYLVGGCQLGLGSLKGFWGKLSTSLKKCLSRRVLLRLSNSLSRVGDDGGDDGRMCFKPRLRSCVSCLERE